MNGGRPNIIWVFGDQQPAHTLSCSGSPNTVTPNIDALAVHGVRFSNAYSTNPLCCPARGSLLTGRYSHHCVPGHQHPLPAGSPTVAHEFARNGYQTGYFGKWHLDGFDETNGRAALHTVPRDRRGGFSTWLGYENNNSQWDCFVHGHASDGAEISHHRLPGYETDELTSRFLGYLGERAIDGTPFFGVLSVQPPHDPYVAPPEYMQRHNPRQVLLRPNVPRVPAVESRARREFAGACAMIENLDANVGRIISTLDELGLRDSTWIVFFSDHGDLHGSHGQFRKTSPYQESIQIPCIVTPPRGENYAAYTVDESTQPIGLVDVAPTSLGLCGFQPPEWMEGSNLAPICRAPRSALDDAPDSVFVQSVIPTRHRDSVDRPWRAVVHRDGWKYVCFEESDWLLSHLPSDPYEQVNLAHNPSARDEKVRLRGLLNEWIERTGDSFSVPMD